MPARHMLFTAALGMLLFAASATTALAEESQGKGQELVEQCQQQALQGPKGETLRGKSIEESNAADYQSGEAFELHVDFMGHGNTFHNVTCQVDEQGKVTYEKVEQSGQPQS